MVAGLVRAEIPAFSQDRAWDDLITQCEMGVRNPGSTGHEVCGNWIHDRLESLGYQVEAHRFSMPDPYSDGELELTNYRAWLPGAQGYPLAFGAHWDTRPRADLEKDEALREEPILGANDGASAVAVLLELARLCAETPPPLPVEFLFFDGEDYGRSGERHNYLLGSTRFVQDHPGYSPRLLVLLDMVGGKRLNIRKEPFSMQAAPGQLDRIFDLAEEMGLPAFIPETGPAVWDDHIPFIQRGIPAVDLVDFRFPQWHTLADTPEACSPSSLAQVGALSARMIFETPVVW
jgi:glutaminyl-peptide cyclotransferase